MNKYSYLGGQDKQMGELIGMMEITIAHIDSLYEKFN